MSGVKVEAMICWTINRVGDGPLKAYQNLGADIISVNPKMANYLISNVASAVMRNRISNTNMDDVLTNRQMLRKAVRDEIDKVVNGWGVWLETVEITDVKISSGELFKHMQGTFRED
jgi:regulator of protease activity HflC (stomatin/prohibitin superfamily)